MSIVNELREAARHVEVGALLVDDWGPVFTNAADRIELLEALLREIRGACDNLDFDAHAVGMAAEDAIRRYDEAQEVGS